MDKKDLIVYIVGGDHHNGLGLARQLGLNGITVVSLAIAQTQKSFIANSKFILESHVFHTEKAAMDYLLTVPTEGKRAFILPYSDSAALELDNRLDAFRGRFIVPSINEKQGGIANLMDKQTQYHFAREHGIRMALTVTADIRADQHPELDEMVYPCIIKPVISAEGSKRDIAICQSRAELNQQVARYKEKGYWRALVQEYLTIDYEIDVFGCILRQEPGICQIPTHTIRSWLPKGGTNSFSRIITKPEIVDGCRRIIQELRKIGFYGLYDIELFVVNGEILLNEINLRNSGDVYMGLHQGYYYAYSWILDALGEKVMIEGNPKADEYAMTEGADIRNIFAKNVSVGQWIADVRRSKDFALWFRGDLKPALVRYLYYFKVFIAGKRL